MSRWHNNYADGCAHFYTFTVRNWQPELTEEVVQALYSEWKHARRRFSVRILAYVIMPEHVHMLVWSPLGSNVRTFIQRTLGQTSKRFSPGQGKFWKERPRVFPVHSEKVIREKIDYIHENPVRRELVSEPTGWRDSSFRQLVGGEEAVRFVCDPFPGGG